MEENTIRITKKDDEELIFDISRITETICQMFEALSVWDNLIDDILENVKIAFYTALHSICHCIANGFLSRRRSERTTPYSSCIDYGCRSHTKRTHYYHSI